MSSITLHPKYGVNPTLGVCLWCGEQDGTIGLMGYNKGREAPRHSVISAEPCDKCKAGMALGITLIEADSVERGNARVQLRPGVYITGRWMVVTEDAVRRWFNDADAVAAMLRHRKAFLEPAAYAMLIAAQPREGE